jgi:nucleotide-binding universal stress UspA family protein
MAYKTILVTVDDSPAAVSRIDLAIDLGIRHQAHVIGLSLAIAPSMPHFAQHPLLADAIAAQQEHINERASKALETFRAKADEARIDNEARLISCVDFETVDHIATHGRYADLLVIGQSDPDDPGPGGPAMPEHVVLGAGLPVLIVPYIGTHEITGKRVMVAWNAGREAARAVRDALPLLREAEHVEVVVADPEGLGDVHGEEPGSDVGVFLARHGCNVEVERLPKGGLDPADVLLSYLVDRNSDLLVMGAYGHTRLRELVLGGMTQKIMHQMTVPVLMSH